MVETKWQCRRGQVFIEDKTEAAKLILKCSWSSRLFKSSLVDWVRFHNTDGPKTGSQSKEELSWMAKTVGWSHPKQCISLVKDLKVQFKTLGKLTNDYFTLLTWLKVAVADNMWSLEALEDGSDQQHRR